MQGLSMAVTLPLAQATGLVIVKMLSLHPLSTSPGPPKCLPRGTWCNSQNRP